MSHFFSAVRIISGVALNSEHIDQLLSSSAWIGAFIIEILFVCHSCSMTHDEVAKIGRNLHNVAWQLENVNCKIQVIGSSLLKFWISVTIPKAFRRCWLFGCFSSKKMIKAKGVPSTRNNISNKLFDELLFEIQLQRNCLRMVSFNYKSN